MSSCMDHFYGTIKKYKNENYNSDIITLIERDKF